MKKSSNATTAAFGWDFQCNAAIMLMLKNIKSASTVRVEGATEDIEIALDNGNIIFSQAKSVQKPYDDFSNVKTKLKDGLKTLSKASAMPNVEQLIYITNSPNPFNDKITMGAFSGGFSMLDYNDLPSSCKDELERIITSEQININRKMFSVYVMQFHGDGENRYKILYDKTNEFLASIGMGDRGFGPELLRLWQSDFFKNSSQSDLSLTISKKQLVWPLIVSLCNINSEDAYFADSDDGDIDDIIHRYGAIINNNSERFEFVTKVLTGYNKIVASSPSLSSRERTKQFINQNWTDYKDEFVLPASDDIMEQIVKLTISNVIKRRRNINQIKSEVNL